MRIVFIGCLALFSSGGFSLIYAGETAPVDIDQEQTVILVSGEIEATPVKGSSKGFISRWRDSRIFKEAESNPDYDPTAGGPQSGKFEEQYKSLPADLKNYKFKQVDRKDDQLVGMVEQAIDVTAMRALTANMHTPWQIFHGILALRHNLLMNVGNKRISAIEWVSTANPVYNGEYLFERTAYGGRTHKFTDPYIFEGHPYQFLGIITMSDLPLTHQFKVRNGSISLQDIVNGAKMEVNSQEEITWILWFLAHYLEPDDEWTNARGEQWSIEKLVRLQTQADVLRGACGGCHGLFAMAFARNNYLKKTNEPLRGIWIDAEQKLQRYISMAQSIQNRDGSFPTKYFKGYGETADYSERLAAPGHMMEWLMIALPDDRLKEPWVRKGIEYLARTIISYRNIQVDCGPLYHALDALVIYRDRMRKLSDEPQIKQELAEKKPAVNNKPAETKVDTAMADTKTSKESTTNNMVVDQAPAIVPENTANTAKIEGNHPLTTQESNMPMLVPDNKKPTSTALGEKQTQGISANKNVNDILNNANMQKSKVDPNDSFMLPEQLVEGEVNQTVIAQPESKTDTKTQLKNVIQALSVPPVNIAPDLKSSQGWKKSDVKLQPLPVETPATSQGCSQPDCKNSNSGDIKEHPPKEDQPEQEPEQTQQAQVPGKKPQPTDEESAPPPPPTDKINEDFDLPVKLNEQEQAEEEGQPAPEIED